MNMGGGGGLAIKYTLVAGNPRNKIDVEVDRITGPEVEET